MTRSFSNCLIRFLISSGVVFNWAASVSGVARAFSSRRFNKASSIGGAYRLPGECRDGPSRPFGATSALTYDAVFRSYPKTSQIRRNPFGRKPFCFLTLSLARHVARWLCSSLVSSLKSKISFRASSAGFGITSKQWRGDGQVQAVGPEGGPLGGGLALDVGEGDSPVQAGGIPGT